MLKATFILSAYHSLCTLCQGMGIEVDEDLKEDMLILLGPDALIQEKSASPSTKKIRCTNYYSSDAGMEGDQSSVSHSMNSSKLDDRSENIFKTLRRKQKLR